MAEPTIEDLKQIQLDRSLYHMHVVWVGPDGFRIAHTNHERSLEKLGGPKLSDCALHRWLMSLDEAPVEPGIYTVNERTPDPYSSDWGELPYDFMRLIGHPEFDG